MNNIFQWAIRIILSALLLLLIFSGTSSFFKNNALSQVITFIIFTIVLTGILHLISIIPVFKNASHFKKYIFSFIGIIILAVILFFSFVLYIFFSGHGNSTSGGKINCSVCEKNQYKDECYYECAMQNSDITICEKLNDIGYKNKCYAWVSVKSDKFFCDKIIEEDENQASSNKTVCYTHFAVENKDISLCDKIPLRDNFHLPRYSCYQQVAVTLQDPSVCAKIPNVYPISGYEKNTALINTLKQLKSDCLILKK